MFPISYKHPKAQADLHCVFMKPHIHSSTCDRKVAGGEEPSAAELDLKPEVGIFKIQLEDPGTDTLLIHSVHTI